MIIIKNEIEKILSSVTDEYKKEAELIIEAISGQSKEELLMGEKLKNADKILEVAKKRAKTGMPIQQILGFAFFMGEKFLVDENVLIPRDETEILVRETLSVIKNFEKPEILEIGVGSGCVSCMIAKSMPNYPLQILGVDISVGALKVAINNVEKFVEANRVLVRKSDLFSNVKGKFDIIISNPPYIDKNEILQPELKFEPKCALFAEDNGYYFYKKIIEEAPKFLNKGGFILFELGMGQAETVQKFLEKDFSNIELIEDIQGHKRVIKARF